MLHTREAAFESGDRAAPPAQAPAPRPGPATVAERPRLAPNVRLSGMMGEGGFTEQQWLVERGGRFIQVSTLLYQVLAQANGERTLDDIAAAVSEATGRRVSADNVRQLLERKLIPLGLVMNADGTVVTPQQGAGAARSLRVNMKMARISPRYINPLTSILQFLYWPPVLIAVVVAGFFAEGWMFFVQGIGGSIHDALATPGLLLAALGMVILAAAYHELGHAAALRYGKGEVRGMGAGIYLVYPVFYTDVSDNYRLGRWARVRTDLGGFYFNLIFALAVMTAYVFSGLRFLLLVVLLIDFDIVRQLMPFVRLDGYWVLADLTGIPDFFSQMGPFLRTVLPIPGWKGRRLPNLKPWVKLVFGLYILITVPLLFLLMLVTVKSVPRVLATAWVTYGRLFADIGSAWEKSSALGVTAGVVQVLTLTLPTLGLLVIVYTLGKSLFAGIWRWGRPSPLRRASSTVMTAALAGFVVWLWLPQLPALLPGLGGRSSPLYAQSAFRPIAAGERGTVGDALSTLPGLGARFSSSAGAAPAKPSPVPEPTTAPHSGARPAVAPSPIRLPILEPQPVPPLSSTPAATPSAAATAAGTPRPTAGTAASALATARATPTPTATAARPAQATARGSPAARATARPPATATTAPAPLAVTAAANTATPTDTATPSGEVTTTDTPTPTAQPSP